MRDDPMVRNEEMFIMRTGVQNHDSVLASEIRYFAARDTTDVETVTQTRTTGEKEEENAVKVAEEEVGS
jgi:hypothetical protein